MASISSPAASSRRRLLRALNLLTEGADVPLGRALRAPAQAFHRAQRVWAEADGIQGFGIAFRTRGGRSTAELVLKVYVDRKLPLARCPAPVPAALAVPGSHVPVPIDVEPIGRIGFDFHTDSVRPLRPGISISRITGPAGTLGCLVRRRGQPAGAGILGSAHVLASGARIGDAILQPSAPDGGVFPADHVADLSGWAPLEFSRSGFPNHADAAFAELVIRPAPPDEFDVEMLPTAVGGAPRRGMRVYKTGRTTGETTAIVRDVDFRFAVRFADSGRETGRIGFRGQVLCSRFTGRGDSGAAVLNGRGAIVGLHVASAESASVFTPIAAVCDTLDVDIVTRAT